MKKMGKVLLRVFGSLAVLILVSFTVLYFNQETLVFHPDHLKKDFRFEFQTPFEEKFLKLGDSSLVNYLVFNPKSVRGDILYFHGNGGSLRNCGETADRLAQRTGWSVWMMDYPGFGKNTSPLVKTDKVLIDMGNQFVDLIQKERPSLPLLIYGRSLGTGIASLVAANHAPLPLVLETPYVSLAKIGHQKYPILPEFFSRFDLDTARGLQEMLDRRVLILHGTDDHTIPVSHGRELAQISKHHHYVEFNGGDHDNLDTFPKYWTALEEFLRESEK